MHHGEQCQPRFAQTVRGQCFKLANWTRSCSLIAHQTGTSGQLPLKSSNGETLGERCGVQFELTLALVHTATEQTVRIKAIAACTMLQRPPSKIELKESDKGEVSFAENTRPCTLLHLTDVVQGV